MPLLGAFSRVPTGSWFRLMVRSRCLPRLPTYPTSRITLPRHLLLDAEIVRDHAGVFEGLRGSIDRFEGKCPRRAARRIIDIAVEDAGRHVERRIAAGIDQGVGGCAVVEDAEAAADRGPAPAERIVREAGRVDRGRRNSYRRRRARVPRTDACRMVSLAAGMRPFALSGNDEPKNARPL